MGHPTYLFTIFYNLFMYLPTYLPTTYQPTYLHTFVFTYLLQPTYPTHPPTYCVATLTLGSRPRQGLAKGWDKRETQEAHFICCNPNLRLVTKAKVCKRAKQEGDLGGTFYTPESVGECERMNPHIPKATPSWGVEVSKDSQIFKGRLQGSKPIGLKISLYH
jgi:hypothetical protein